MTEELCKFKASYHFFVVMSTISQHKFSWSEQQFDIYISSFMLLLINKQITTSPYVTTCPSVLTVQMNIK